MKKKCPVCQRAPGKRTCFVRENALICPVCCAAHRDEACVGCSYYTQAQKYQQGKIISMKSEHFIIEINPEVEREFETVIRLIENKELAQASTILVNLNFEFPRNYLVQYGLGILAAIQEDLDRAIHYFDQSLAIYPYFVDAQYNKAVAYEKKLDIAKAITAFRRVVTIGDPDDEVVLKSQIFLNLVKDDIEKTDGISVDRYLEGQSLFDQAFNYLSNQAYEKAIRTFYKVIEILHNHPQSKGNIGLCYGFLGDKHLAIKALDKAIELDPEYEVALINKRIINDLPEGVPLSSENGRIVDYYKERILGGPLLISDT